MPESFDREAVLQDLHLLQSWAHATSLKSGWWVEHDLLRSAITAFGGDITPRLADDLYIFARSMLIVSEVSEGVEARRNADAPDDKLPQYSGVAVELADVIIRVFDLAARFELPVMEALLDKLKYNESRSYKHGGKSI